MKRRLSKESRADIRGAAIEAFYLYQEGRHVQAVNRMRETWRLAELRERTGSSLETK